MGDKNSVTIDYMSDEMIFADVFNYFIYGGKQVINPENLRELDTKYNEVPYSLSGEISPVERIRDLLKYLILKEDINTNTIYVMLGIENQSDIHYAMPVRDLMYDALEYADQARRIKEAHKIAGDKIPSKAEYLSGIYKTDKLTPVITLVVYFGAEKWDGPRSLFEMFPENIDPQILRFVQDYKINLIVPSEMSDADIDKFQTSLREVMKFIKYSKDKNKIREIVNSDERFTHIERNAFNVINICTNSNLKSSDNKEVVDMCQAILDIREDARNEGIFDTRVESFKILFSLGKDFDEIVKLHKMTSAEAKIMREHLEKNGYGNIIYKQ